MPGIALVAGQEGPHDGRAGAIDEVEAAARRQGISDLGQIRVGALEPGGSLSFPQGEPPS